MYYQSCRFRRATASVRRHGRGLSRSAPRMRRHDALKILGADLSADRDYGARFSREADLASTLYHPHIVGVHDRGEHEGQLWVSVDYVDGVDAGRLLAERYPAGMPVDEVVEVVQIVTAVAAARWIMPTARACFIGTSNPPTSCCRMLITKVSSGSC